MSKKDYQAIADAIYRASQAAINTPHAVNANGGIVAEIISEIAMVMRADNPAFNRDLFLEACETGKCRGMKARS